MFSYEKLRNFLNYAVLHAKILKIKRKLHILQRIDLIMKNLYILPHFLFRTLLDILHFQNFVSKPAAKPWFWNIS